MIIPIGIKAQNHIIYSTQTRYLINSPECPEPTVVIKLAYNNIPKELYKRLLYLFINKNITENIKNINKKGL